MRDKVNKTLKQTMEMTEKGEIEFALDMKIERDAENGRLKISQKAYIESILRDFGELAPGVKDTPAPVDDIKDEGTHTREEEAEINSKPIRNIIGKLWWIAHQSRPDIYCALHKCSLWQNKPNKKLWTHLLPIIQYLRGTQNLGINFNSHTEKSQKEEFLVSFVDSSFASESGNKSRHGYTFFFLGGLISWSSSCSKRVVLSSTEAECHGLVEAAKEAKWIRGFIKELCIFPPPSPCGNVPGQPVSD